MRRIVYLGVMIHQKIEQEIDLWDAWIEFEHSESNQFGTLYVIGEAGAARHQPKPVLFKVAGSEEGFLVLALCNDHSTAGRRTEVFFSEKIPQLHTYRGIRIYKDSTLVNEISDIEVLV